MRMRVPMPRFLPGHAHPSAEGGACGCPGHAMSCHVYATPSTCIYQQREGHADARTCPCHAHSTAMLILCRERDMLMRWRDLLLESDPDIVIGYNIIGFDLPYLFDRAKVRTQILPLSCSYLPFMSVPLASLHDRSVPPPVLTQCEIRSLCCSQEPPPRECFSYT